jgi:rhodanese-related sulfurtransferase
MKFTHKLTLLFLCIICLISCNTTTAQGVKNITTDEFVEALKNSDKKIILDVRTPEEFANSHIFGAINIDVRSDDFNQKIAKLDKDQPIYIYCLSGGRSANASNILANDGFKTVHNILGGISKWSGENKPTITAEGASERGLSVEQFNSLINAKDSAVFVDFFAPWCAPCKKIKAYIPELQNEFKGKLKVVLINYDENPKLVKALGVTSIPYLKVITPKGTTILQDFHSKEEILAILNK